MASHETKRVAAQARDVLQDRPLIIVSNREPYEHTEKNGRVIVKKTIGGLVSALEPVMSAIGGTWIAWGSGTADRSVVGQDDTVNVPPKKPAYRLRRVWLSDEEKRKYYDGHVNQTLWPLMHLQTEKVRFLRSEWDTYQHVNQRFADAVLQELHGQHGVVWFQDYHFATAPMMLRMAAPHTLIVQFWHIPWPPWEIFRQHPQRRAILEGLLGCDLIGMHIDLYCHNFLECVERELHIPVDFDKNQIILDDRIVRVRALPISIDVAHFQKLAGSVRTEKFMKKIRRGIGTDKKIGLGVERSDYTKGILLKLRALELLFEQHPEWIEKFTYVQISPFSRQSIPSYEVYTRQMSREIQRINARYKTGDWQPIIFIKTAKSDHELSAYFRLADVMIVSARNDGMNLVAKEFIASRMDERGMLVLSEFTGAAEAMPQAVVINPYDLEGFVHALHTGLTMSSEEQSKRMHQLREYVSSHTIFDWIANIFEEIARLQDRKNQTGGNPLFLLDHLSEAKASIQKFKHIELFCDYDGVLSPIASRPKDARIDPSMKDLLIKLRDSASVHVSVISGRMLSDITELVAIERLTYAGNHGLEISGPRLRRVHEDAAELHQRMQELYQTLRVAMRPYSGTIVENKQLGIALHYRLADPQAVSEIIDLFHVLVEKANIDNTLRITSGKQIVEARPNVEWDKGQAVLWILQSLHGMDWKDRVLPVYLGDDQTDEDAFRALRSFGITIHVGTPPHLGTAARYTLESQKDARIFLDWLTHEVQ